ncbi:hypothetical protein [Geobacter sp. SVR]|uniref:hypothetical protein n=1 Tax=Geobacter sp. SVR TaxID=2495594 RepID=UPI00143EF7CA|nr:hypothetical protein [Geobacter sp. SVR]BCS51826.1 hypothetical protein GSVR_01340 [Geobacter sp. SVR]GCF86987.1 hypothetical protein GSbR_35870 [Geobacter sp. SVR]
MREENDSEKLHRTAKLFMDSGDATSEEEAVRKLEGFILSIEVGPDIATSPTRQAILLTTVNTARRCFLGGVYVYGTTDVELLVPWKNFKSLQDAVIDLRGKIDAAAKITSPQIIIGNVPESRIESGFSIRATFDGWCGGVTPSATKQRLSEYKEFTPSGVLAGGLAVSEAFQHVCGYVMAGRRDVGMSLWNPNSNTSWMSQNTGPELNSLPANLWIIGLGHLGQAFLWTLGLLPYKTPDELHLVMHDHDIIDSANDSTSPLTFPELIGKKKTRAMADWCEERGFKTTLIERRFDQHYRLGDDDPRVALCGVDNAQARSVLEKIGFRYIVEAGLGKGIREFMSFQVHSFPSQQKADAVWKEYAPKNNDDELVAQPAYSNLAKKGVDSCGIAMLAGRTVGASFVGSTVASLVVCDILRMIHGGDRYALIDGTLSSLANRTAIYNTSANVPFNPGITKPK